MPASRMQSWAARQRRCRRQATAASQQPQPSWCAASGWRPACRRASACLKRPTSCTRLLLRRRVLVSCYLAAYCQHCSCTWMLYAVCCLRQPRMHGCLRMQPHHAHPCMQEEEAASALQAAFRVPCFSGHGEAGMAGAGKDRRDWLGPRWEAEFAEMHNDNEIVLQVRHHSSPPDAPRICHRLLFLLRLAIPLSCSGSCACM